MKSLILRLSIVPLVILLAACGSSGPPGPDASIEDLNAAFGNCSEGDDWGGPAAAFVDVQQWVRVSRVVSANRDGTVRTPTVPSTVVAADGATHTLSVHFSYWPGVDWALANDAGAWFGIADPSIRETYGYEVDGVVEFALVVLADGRAFFPGNCRLYEALASVLGSDVNPLLSTAPGLVGADLLAHLRLADG